RFCGGLLRCRLLGRLWRVGIGRLVGSLLWRGLLCCSLLGAALRLAAALGGTLVDQRNGLGERDRLGRLVARDRGVDAAGRDVSAVAAILHCDAAKARMLAERLARVGAEAAAARALGDLFRNQRHCTIEADVEHLIAGFQAGIGLFVTHERAEA